MSGKLSREKGKRGEREVAAILRGHGFAGRRGQQYSGTETTADVIGLPGFHLEVKRTERLDLYGAYHQAVADAGDSGDVPVVVHRKNGQPWLAALPLEDFLRLVMSCEREDPCAEHPGPAAAGGGRTGPEGAGAGGGEA